MQRLNLDLGDRSYPISIGKGLLTDGDWTTLISAGQVCVVTNETIAPLYLEKVTARLQGKKLSTVILPDGEQYKSLETLNLIFDRLLGDGHNRTTTLIALGGGVIGDMTGFAAACYQRGVQFIQIPTTLLSMVDSSVGGKTGVNHPLGKNMIGAFYQPRCVVIDTDTLGTLPDREFSAGLAEVIKYGLIADPEFYQWLLTNWDGLLGRNRDLLEQAIYRSCRCKAEVVAGDERESGRRAILNLGHTFGHAIETAVGYGAWLHGEAVAAGMVVALDLSVRLGWIREEELQRLINPLERAGLPVRVPEAMSCDTFIDLMARDKKVLDGQLRLVLLSRIGHAVISADASREQICDSLRARGAV